MPITKFFLQKRIFTFILLALLIAAGVKAFTALNVETVPQVTTPVIYVAIPLPGAAPEEIETQIINPLEEKLSEIEDVDIIASSCWENVGISVLFFDDRVDPKKGFEVFREKVAEARALMPADIMEPRIEEVSFENLPMMFLGLKGEGRNPHELSMRAEKLRRELEQVKGVKGVLIAGATAKRVQIEVDPEKLKKYDPSVLRTLTDRLGQINTNIPGGRLEVMGSEKLVRTVGRFDSLEDLNDLVLGTVDGKPVAVGDIGRATIMFPASETRVSVMGKPGVTLGVLKKRGDGTIDVAREVRKVLEKYPDVVVLNDQSESIKRDMGALRVHSIYGTILVLLVLFAFLGFRVAAIVSTALPLSVLITFIAMAFEGMTIDMVSLFALVLALGMMVDNAIVVCENIFRHMSLGKPPHDAALEATDEVGWPILSSTLCTVAAFLPMLMISSTIGQFTRPIPIVVTFALVSSYIVALCFNPILSSAFIRSAPAHGGKKKKWKAAVRNGYESILSWALDHRPAVIIAAVLIFIGSVFLIPYVGIELFPQLDTSKVYIDVKTPTGTPLGETRAAVARIEKMLSDSGKVKRFISSTGSTGMRVEIDDRVFYGSNRARILVDLKDSSLTKQPHKKTISQFRKQSMKLVPEGSEVHFVEKILGPPVGPPVDIRVSGKDMEDLRIARDKIVREMKKMKLVDVKDDFPSDIPQVVIKMNHKTAGAIGLTTREVGGLIFLTLTGHEIGAMTIDEETLPIFLKIKPPQMNINPLAMASGGGFGLGGTNFSLPDGRTVSFSDLADINLTYGYSTIEHENGRRTVSISAGLGKGQLAQRMCADLTKRLPSLKLPKDVDVRFAGETMLIDTAFGDLKKALVISLILIYIILLIEFRSTLQPLIILTCVPYALVGVVFGLLITKNSFGILSFIGVVCLTGIVVNNAIILIDYVNLLRKRGTPLRKAIIDAAQTRLRPIIMTKSTVILGVLPLAATASDKTQFWKPLCWSIIWGLIVATTLTLVIIPVVYSITEGWRERYYDRRGHLKGN